MSRQGHELGLLRDRHASECGGREFSTCRPVVVPAGAQEEPTYYDSRRGGEIVVVFMAWCGDCGAADWEVV